MVNTVERIPTPLVTVSEDSETPHIVIDMLDQKPRDLAHANILLQKERPELWEDGFRARSINEIEQNGGREIVVEREHEDGDDLFPDVLYVEDSEEKEDIPF